MSKQKRGGCTPVTIALAGNPNVGKSTVFNNLTGLRQHTGNWTGKTVENARGFCRQGGREYLITDLPGTYSISPSSAEEELSSGYLCFGEPNAVIVVADATALERNLNLLFQIMEITPRVALCVNLIDEADKKGIEINCELLSQMLGIPVRATAARRKKDALRLLEAADTASCAKRHFKVQYCAAVERAVSLIESDVARLCGGRLNARFAALKMLGEEPKMQAEIEAFLGAKFRLDQSYMQNLAAARGILEEANLTGEAFIREIAGSLVRLAEGVAARVVKVSSSEPNKRARKIDRILTSKRWGIPIMLAFLGLIFYITIVLSNYPSELLVRFFGFLGDKINALFVLLNAPEALRAPLVDGVYKTTAWVVSVMLPPMAIFFPLFTFLEDFGYLPRLAFNLDAPFCACGCSGKQSLTMCMGFGCNAAGVTGARIIDSPRERLIAILTNGFVPCNGRFPALIAVAGIFFGSAAANPFLGGLISALMLTAMVALGIVMTFLFSRMLSGTLLKGKPAAFALELPPFRRPELRKILTRSLFDRTIFVLGRAVCVAAPCGLIVWLLGNITADGQPLVFYLAHALEPLGRLMGLDGYILAAFVLGFPANEIVLPIAVMSYTGSGVLAAAGSIAELGAVLVANGWTRLTGFNMLLFTLLHFPCATTLLTVKKETKSLKWTALAAALPTAAGILSCIIFTALCRLLVP